MADNEENEFQQTRTPTALSVARSAIIGIAIGIAVATAHGGLFLGLVLTTQSLPLALFYQVLSVSCTFTIVTERNIEGLSLPTLRALVWAFRYSVFATLTGMCMKPELGLLIGPFVGGIVGGLGGAVSGRIEKHRRDQATAKALTVNVMSAHNEQVARERFKSEAQRIETDAIRPAQHGVSEEAE